jgi:mRNA interferase RelE/StbE
MKRQVYQSPLFERQKKYLSKKEIEHLENKAKLIQGKPEIGEAKRGDLAGVYVHRFKVGRKLFLVAYELNEPEILLLALGPHENFSRDLKKYLK